MDIAGSATGLIRSRTIAKMIVEEVDRALQKSVNYRAPAVVRPPYGREQQSEGCSQCSAISLPVANHALLSACEGTIFETAPPHFTIVM